MTAASPPPPPDDLVYVPFPHAALGLVHAALLQAAGTRRRASEAAAAELLAGRQPGEDIRTPSTHIVGMLGEAGTLESAAATVADYAGGITGPPPPVPSGLPPAAARPSRRHLRVAAPPELDPRAAAQLSGEQRAAATLASLQAAPPEDLAGPPVNLAEELDIDEPALDDVVDVDLGGPVG